MTNDLGSVGFIGAGNMAEAIVRGLVARGVVPAAQVTVSDPSEARRTLLAEGFGVRATASNEEVVANARIIVLAVKPQMMAQALGPVAAAFRADHLVISIAAGLRTETLDALCARVPAIVRVMPNTPALVGQGVSALCAGPRAGASHLALAETLFSTVGTTVQVEEGMMDAVTAVSGSGPAYVFYWMEAMLKAAGDLGFSPVQARQLVYETLAGAAALATASTEPPEVLRAKVTSKGGTTEAAINHLEAARVRDLLAGAVMAAAERSRALSRLA
jgi:pyrroline-5-carboxylate reductase